MKKKRKDRSRQYSCPIEMWYKLEAEARRRRRVNGEDIKWTRVLYEILVKFFAEKP